MVERITVNSKKPVSIKENQISHRRKTDFRSNSSPVNRILYLQRTIGNQAVQRMVRSGALQAKLSIGQPGDVYEQEADRVADAVMRMPEPGVQREVEPEEEEEEMLQAKPLAEEITPLVQRQVEPEEEEEETLQTKQISNQITPLIQVQRQEEPEEEEEEMLQAKPLAEEITPLVQRQVEPEEEEELQTKATSDHLSEVTPNLESHIQSLKGGGQPLQESARARFEPRFGHDFSQVRVHTDAQAAESAQAVNAQAFTVGKDVVFGEGEYSLGSSTGQKLLAHELTHVIQQNDRSDVRQRRASTSFTRLSEPTIQLTPKGGWDETSALLECNSQIDEWQDAGYNFAANLLQYFLNKEETEDYTHTSADLAEIKKYAAPEICDKIDKVVNYTYIRSPIFIFKYGPGTFPVTISHPGKGSDESSNIRWLYIISNKNMLYAYGGADLNVEGEVTIKENKEWIIFTRRTWNGEFAIALGDKYTFESTSSIKTWISSAYNDAYDAALWLEKSNNGYKSFYHNAKFPITCSRVMIY